MLHIQPEQVQHWFRRQRAIGKLRTVERVTKVITPTWSILGLLQYMPYKWKCWRALD